MSWSDSSLKKKELSDEVLDATMDKALTFVRKNAEKIYLDELKSLVDLGPEKLGEIVMETLKGKK